jgi:hypothetical protein
MRRAHLWVLVLAASGALVAGCAGDKNGGDQAPKPYEGARSEFFGINGDVMFVQLEDGQGSAIQAPLDQLAATPLGFVRSSIDWRRLQPSPPGGGPNFDFSTHDAWVADLAARHLRWAPTLLGFPVPAWAADPALVGQCGSKAPPAQDSSYAAMAAALAARYGRGGRFWRQHPFMPYEPVTDYEIWNEPNHSAFWCPRPDPARFAGLVVAASDAIRQVDPKAGITLGGLANFGVTEPAGAPLKMTPGDYIPAAVSSNPRLADAVSSVAFHPYGSTPDAVMQSLEDFRATLDTGALQAKPISVNEIGWPSAGPPVSFTVISDESQRADYLSQVTDAIGAQRAELGLDLLAPYAWTTAEANPNDPEDFFGMADPVSGAPYKSGQAYLDAVNALITQP